MIDTTTAYDYRFSFGSLAVLIVLIGASIVYEFITSRFSTEEPDRRSYLPRSTSLRPTV